MGTENKDKFLFRLIRRAVAVRNVVQSGIGKINAVMGKRFSSSWLALLAVITIVGILIFTITIPPFLGVSDDGSFSRIMNSVGIFHYSDTPENLYFNYYVRNYAVMPLQATNVAHTSLLLFIRFALFLNNLFGNGSNFDMRFMGLVYGLMFLPAIYMIVKQAVVRTGNFTESLIVMTLGVLIFGDITYCEYFCSFYKEPLMFVCALLCMGALMSMRSEGPDVLRILVFIGAGMVLTLVKKQCSLVGFILALMSMRLFFVKKDGAWRTICVAGAIALLVCTSLSFFYIDSDFTIESKYNAMTRGVLLESKDPAKTLEEFAIDPSYEILADTSAYATPPTVKADNKVLYSGFYDKYDSMSILIYYLKHPGSMLGMLDISVRASMESVRGYNGNYEKSAGKSPMSKSVFWTAWSQFKSGAAPHTIGFLVVLAIAILILYLRRVTRSTTASDSRGTLTFITLALMLAIGLSQAVTAIVESGDGDIQKQSFLLGLAIDLVSYYLVAEVIHRTNIFAGKASEKK